MRADITLLELSIRRRSLLAYVAGMALYTLLIDVLYPQFKNTTSLNDLTKGGSTAAALFGLTGSLTSPTGWLNANIYENFLPLIILLLSIGYGAAAIAGQDEDGTLGLMAVLPLKRRSLLFHKASALLVQVLALSIVVAGFVWLGKAFQIDVSIAHILGISLTTLFMGMDFGLLSLAVGAATGKRGTTLGICTALAAVSYIISSLAPVVGWIRPMRFASLLYWSVGQNQILNGITVTEVIVLLAVGCVAFYAAVLAFRRLDLH